MSEQPMRPVRVFFTKTGRARYISHLDTMRTLTRAFKRSGLPFWYTQGFNPHLYMTFALPLALGAESLSESLDARFVEAVDYGEAKRALAASLPPGFEVLRLADPVMDPDSIAWAEYRIGLRYPDGASAAAQREALERFFARERIEVTKKTKKAEKLIDIRPHAVLLGLEADGTAGDDLELLVRLAAGNRLNIAPRLLFDAFYEDGGAEPASLSVTRIRVSDAENRDFC